MDPVESWRIETLRELVGAPVQARADEWNRRFDAAFWPASLAMPTEWLWEAPDGRGFLVLTLGTMQEGSRPGRPAALVDFLIAHRLGLLLRDPQGSPAAYLPHGYVLGYRCFGRAFEPRPSGGTRQTTLRPGEIFGLAPPQDPFFPQPVRDAIRAFLRDEFGFAEPRATVGTFPDGGRKLVFDFEPARLGEARVAQAFESIRWFLPPRLAFARVDAWNAFEEMRAF